jgi:hypothetical protein
MSFTFQQDPDTGNWKVIDDATGKVYRGFDPLGAANDAIRSLPNLLPSEIAALQAQARSIEADLRVQQQAKNQVNNNATSVGATVAASDDAGVTNPTQAPKTITPDGRINARPVAGTNADQTPTTANDAGTTVTSSAELKIGETQAPIKPPNTGELKLIADEPPPDPTTPPPGSYGPGVGAGNEDATPTKNLTRQDIEANFNEDIIPQSNILDNYASYTYQISWYLCNESDYKSLITSDRVDEIGSTPRGGQLLVQSGGENQSVGIVGVGSSETLSPSRNQFFSLDYYIDNLSVSNVFQGKGTGTANSYTDLKFTVIEPNGISLIDNLKQAVRAYCGIEAFSSAIYLMVIRWIGYDENGNIVYAGNTNSGGVATDPYAIAVKYIPFAINNIKFSVANRLSTYEITGTPIIYTFKLRQTVPYNTEITGKTVQEILGGSIRPSASVTAAREFNQNTNNNVLKAIGVGNLGAGVVSATPGTSDTTPQNMNASPSGSSNVGRGLMNAMNQYQQQLVKDQIYEIADEFSIEFANPSIANAALKKPGDLAIDKTPMSKSSPRDLLPETAKVYTLDRNFGITAGQSIIQAIEMVVRNSSYITDQQLMFINEETQQEQDNGTPIENFAWFKISMKAEPKGYDRKRNDYAYKFKFLVSIYEVKSINSVWFPRTRFRGVHKSYPYWFTGKNTAVLDYQQSFDNLYLTVISGAGETVQGEYTSALSDIPRFVYQPRSGQSSQGADQATNEPAANAADYLYSPSDLGTVKVKLIGDPAWMQQGEIYRGNDPRTFNFSAFNADGGINFESQEVLFEIVWQRPVDYDIETDGLMNPNRYSSTNSDTANPRSRAGLQSYVFYATRCTHEFRQGRFEQTLDGGLYIFPRSRNTRINSSAANSNTGVSSSYYTGGTNPNSIGFGGGSSSGPLPAGSSQTFPLSGGQTNQPAASGARSGAQPVTRQVTRQGTLRKQVKTGTGASGFPLNDNRVTIPPVKARNTGTDFATAYSLRNQPGGPPRVQTTTPGIRGRQ